MSIQVSLRPVQPSDLPIFFAQQLDPDATRMAAFAARDQDAFTARWRKILAEAEVVVRNIHCGGDVAGNIVCWPDAGEWKVGYWLGKDYWRKGVASAALTQFLELVHARPLVARVAKHNAASLRVLQKCGFMIVGEDRFPWADGEVEEFILMLGANGLE